MMFLKNIILFFIIHILCFSELPGICDETDRPVSDGGRPRCTQPDIESHVNFGAWLARVFRDHVSRVDGDRCPSIPSCSSYSVEAFRKHGFIIGWLMTVDRLIHEADEGSISPVVYHQGGFKVLDPVENNDFWWSCEHGATRK